MSIEFFECAICAASMNDCMPHEICATCERWMCENCAEEMVKKYGKCSVEDMKNFGEDSPKECDNCSKKTLEKRILEKENELECLKKSR